MKSGKKKLLALAAGGMLFCGALLAGCGGGGAEKNTQGGEKVFKYGTVAYGTFNENTSTDPHDTYCGWTTLRYGVGETLFRFNAAMQLEPWLAKDFVQVDDYTIKINLREDVTFSNGKKLTGAAVKACLEDLLKRHDRAPGDLKLTSITAEGQSVTLVSKEKVPALLNYLSDPYGCIMDVAAGVKDRIVVGTGPYKAVKVTDTEVQLVKNDKYWGAEKPKMDKLIIKSIADGDTLTMAIQSGELDAVQGLPYSSLDMLKSDTARYKLSSANTSRIYQGAFNYHNTDLQDIRVRQAISEALDKASFTRVLLHENGTPAVCPFPENMPFGGSKLKGAAFDKEHAKKLLAEAGYRDTDGDGYVDKNGKNLELRWLTYNSRQELPLLAEYMQASLKDIGIKLKVNATDNYKAFLKTEDYDIYAKAFVAAPTGDPEYYFTTHVLDSSAYNHGFYHSDAVEELGHELHNTFDAGKRAELAVKINQELLKDYAFIYASHLKMSLVMKKEVTGFEAHPSDYYEISAKLDKK